MVEYSSNAAWKERFGFFWYNDDELFRYTKQDFDSKAKSFADSGITTVITFSCTHFRWTLRPYWPLINSCLAQVVEACHRNGIKVVEHHSSHLTFDPLNDADWDYMESILCVRHSSLASWPGLREYIPTDPDINGNLLSSFRQIDGRTGAFARTGYHGYAMCFNNPDYRKAYFSYLESVYKTGIDGIMTDDVQYFGDGHACACPHCRELFQKQTGYTLPAPGDWGGFYGDYANPIYIAWKRFKVNSTKEFQFAVNAHYKSLGLEMMRPNYVSSLLRDNWSAYPFEAAGELWDFIFQENCFSTIIRASFFDFALEAIQRFSMGDRKQVPSMSMFYPDREDSLYFAWALSKSWGQLFLGTSEGADLSGFEAKYRAFETEHSRYYQNPKKISDIAFYFSSQTRDYTKDASKKSMLPFVSWLQASYASGISTDMVFEGDSLDTLLEHPLIALVSAVMLSDDELIRLRTYTEQGGRILLVGLCGIYRPDGSIRSIQSFCQGLGIRSYPVPNDKAGIQNGLFALAEKNVQLSGIRSSYVFDAVSDEPVCTLEDGSVTGVRASVGRGEVIWLISDINDSPFQHSIAANRWLKEIPRAPAQPSVLAQLCETSGAVLHCLLQKQLLQTTGSGEWLASCYQTCDKSGYAVHLIRIDGILPVADSVGHEDPVCWFVSGSEKNSELALTLRLPEAAPAISAMLYTPESEKEISLPTAYENGAFCIRIPAESFSGYALIALERI